MARLDRLVAAKEVAQIGSVIGREFSFELLQSVSTLPRKDLQEALGELVQAGLATTSRPAALIRPTPSSTPWCRMLPTPLCYASDAGRFICVWPSCSKKKPFAPKVLCLRSSHGILAKRGRPDRSIDYYLKAAERTNGRFALTERVSHLRKGLRQIEHLPEFDGDRASRAYPSSCAVPSACRRTRLRERGGALGGRTGTSAVPQARRHTRAHSSPRRFVQLLFFSLSARDVASLCR